MNRGFERNITKVLQMAHKAVQTVEQMSKNWTIFKLLHNFLFRVYLDGADQEYQ